MASSGHDEDVSQGSAFESGRGLDRVVFFSDAVFAIAMTLLALSLRLPSTTKDRDVAQALVDALPSISSYVLSFAIIALYWLAHHRMFRYICRVDAVLLFLNLATLGVVAFVPFPTSVLGDHGNTTAAVVFYAATMVLLGGLASALWGYASHTRRLITADTPTGFGAALDVAKPRRACSVRRFDTYCVRGPECSGMVLALDRPCTVGLETSVREHLQADRVDQGLFLKDDRSRDPELALRTAHFNNGKSFPADSKFS